MNCRLLLSGFSMLLPLLASAEITRVDVAERSDVGSSGYEQIIGRMHFAIDPAHARNRIIADVDLAPVNAAGKVEFSSDLRILRPKDASRSNGAAWVEIPNRGGKGGLSKSAMQQGFTMMEVGWEFDLPGHEGKVRIEVPAARQKDGSAIRGVVSATFVVDHRADHYTLGDMDVYPPVDAAGLDSRLIVRNAAAFPEGKEIPRAQWKLEGKLVTIEGGFEPGKTYEISYLAENPPVGGLGFAAVRDAVAWLKYGGDDTIVPKTKHVYAFGSSQCGRFLRDLVYQGFNTDERDRGVFDGIISHIAGAGRLDLNRRWSLPRSLAIYQSTSYPFADTAQKDPITGLSEGLLENPRVKHRPKMFYVNTGSEYWGAGRVAALTHTNVTGTEDIPLPSDARMYYFAGTQHGAAAFPPAPPRKDALRGNPVNSRASVQALRQALHRWVAEGTEPPASAYPKLSDGTLVPIADVRMPNIPGVESPRRLTAGVRMRNQLIAKGAGAGSPLPLLVPQLDADGNELGGIRLPDLTVPLATSLGWTLRPPSIGEPNELIPLHGAWVPFPATQTQREQSGDPRKSITERYASKEKYLERVKEAAQRLADQGYLLPEDREGTIKQAEVQWDWVTAQSAQ